MAASPTTTETLEHLRTQLDNVLALTPSPFECRLLAPHAAPLCLVPRRAVRRLFNGFLTFLFEPISSGGFAAVGTSPPHNESVLRVATDTDYYAQISFDGHVFASLLVPKLSGTFRAVASFETIELAPHLHAIVRRAEDVGQTDPSGAAGGGDGIELSCLEFTIEHVHLARILDNLYQQQPPPPPH